MKVRSLQDLGGLRDALAQARREAEEARRRAEEERLRLDRERRQFELAVGAVRPLKAAARADLRPEPPAPHPRQKELDEARALVEAMSDEVDVESLLLTDDGLGFRRPGISLDVLGHLRKGKWAIQAQLDLHGLLVARAHRAGLRAIGTTLTPVEGVVVLPGYDTPAKEALRQGINAWIRTAGAFDSVIDFDQLARDPAHPARLLGRLAAADHLHPNDAGYAAIADAVPLDFCAR